MDKKWGSLRIGDCSIPEWRAERLQSCGARHLSWLRGEEFNDLPLRKVKSDRLLVSSNPFVGNYLIRSTETWQERRPVAEMPTADAIVVLSAGRTVAPGKARFSEWGDANLCLGGVELFQAQRAPY